MLISVTIIFLAILYIFMEWYRLRFFFEKYFITVSIDKDSFEVKKASILKKNLKTRIAWTDIRNVYKVEGHDSNGWWYRNVEKKTSSGLYWRLVIKTTSGAFVFHPSSTEGLSVARFVDKFDLSSHLESEILKRNIPIEKADIQLIETILTKKDWYKMP